MAVQLLKTKALNSAMHFYQMGLKKLSVRSYYCFKHYYFVTFLQ